MLVDFKLPELGENITSGVATKVMVKPGDVLKKDQIILELETDKAVLEIPSSLGGVVKEILVAAGKEVKVGQVILKIEPAEASGTLLKEQQSLAAVSETSAPLQTAQPSSPLPPASTLEPKSTPVSPVLAQSDVPAAPSVRRFAREIGIDLAQVPGSGPHGRISIEDVKAFAKQLNSRLMQGTHTPSLPRALPDFSKWGLVERKAMSQIRKKTAEHLQYASATIPHVTQFDETDITEIEKLRKRFSKKAEAMGGKLTITPFLLKVIASALKNFPQFNSSVDMERNEIVTKKYVHIGVAVDTDRGLVVPVIRDVDKKNIFDLALELTRLAEQARLKKTTLEEMQGGCFTLTNLGGIGGTAFTPIVNWPEVAILGVSRAKLQPVYVENQLVPRLMLPLSLSYDHRLIDGADGARFLRWLADAIQEPLLLELEN